MTLQGLLHSILTLIVSRPESIRILPIEGENSITLETHVHADDVGGLVDHNAHVTASIEDILRAANKERKRVVVRIVDSRRKQTARVD
jgi:predicted RNA-binding protein YlqC (UPF0109 family)